MAEIARKTKRYPSDLTNEEWERIQPLLPKPPNRGRKVYVDLREMLNTSCYMARSGGGFPQTSALGRQSTGSFGASYGACCSRLSVTCRRCSTTSAPDAMLVRPAAALDSQTVRRSPPRHEATTPTRRSSDAGATSQLTPTDGC